MPLLRPSLVLFAFSRSEKRPPATTMRSTPARPSWDAFASEYERRVEPFTSQFAEEMLRPLIDDGAADGAVDRGVEGRRRRLLDVGCGTGAASLIALSGGLDVAWTDVSPAMVERTRQRVTEKEGGRMPRDDVGDDRRSRVSDGQSLPAEWSDRFDIAVSNFSVIFFPDPTAGLGEMLRCLAPSTGVAAFTAWGDEAETPAFRIFPEVAGEAAPHLVPAGRPRRITGSVETLAKLMEDAGFVDVTVAGPITKTLVVSSPEAYYDRFALASPPNAEMIARMDAGLRNDFRRRIMATAKERGGRDEDGSVALDSAAYIAYGRKP